MRETLQKPIFIEGAREKRSLFLTFSLFYKQNALIYAIKFSMQQKCTHISREKLPWPPRKFWAASGPGIWHNFEFNMYSIQLCFDHHKIMLFLRWEPLVINWRPRMHACLFKVETVRFLHVLSRAYRSWYDMDWNSESSLACNFWFFLFRLIQSYN